MQKLKLGFTLAEVLITLGIIGIIAEITLPSLITNVNNTALSAGWRKEYSILSQAYQMVSSSGSIPYQNYLTGISDIEAQLKTTKICVDSQTEGCWHKPNEWLNYPGNKIAVAQDYRGLVLNDGALVMFLELVYGVGSLSPFESFNNMPLVMYVDVNGFKKPNQLGVDVFTLEMFGDRVLPFGAPLTGYDTDNMYCNKTFNVNSSMNGMSCSDSALLN